MELLAKSSPRNAHTMNASNAKRQITNCDANVLRATIWISKEVALRMIVKQMLSRNLNKHTIATSAALCNTGTCQNGPPLNHCVFGSYRTTRSSGTFTNL